MAPRSPKRPRAEGTIVEELHNVTIRRKLNSRETWRFTFFIDQLKARIAELEARVEVLERKKKTR